MSSRPQVGEAGRPDKNAPQVGEAGRPDKKPPQVGEAGRPRENNLTIVSGRADEGDWHVIIMLRSESGALVQARLNAAEARAAARQLTEQADLIERGWEG